MWSFEEITFGQDIVATILIFISWENQAANPVDLVSDLVQFWCNWHGEDGFCALDGQIVVNSIERMDAAFPHGKDVQLCRPIQDQMNLP